MKHGKSMNLVIVAKVAFDKQFGYSPISASIY